MNQCNIEFLLRNGINIDEITREIDCRVHTLEDISPILNGCGRSFLSEEKPAEVSIGDILGQVESFGYSSHIFETLDNYFEENGDGYHTRSIGLLELDPDTIIETLMQSFKREPIKCYLAEDGKYVISINGMHRFTVLRILYLKQLQETLKNGGDVEELKQRFTIPVDVQEIDKEMAYTTYLVKQCQHFQCYGWKIKERGESEDSEHEEYVILEKGRGQKQYMTLTKEEGPILDNSVKEISREYNRSTYQYTGNIKVTLIDGRELIMTPQEYLEFAKKIVERPDNYMILREVENYYKRFESFRQFIDEHFSEVFPFKQQTQETGEGRIDD